MKKHDNKSSPLGAMRLRRFDKKRWGSIILLSTGIMIMVFGFLAFTVDLGYIALTKGQLQAAGDAGVRAGAFELKSGLGANKRDTPEEVAAVATQAAVAVAAANRAGDVSAVYADPTRDLRFGQVIYDPVSGTWDKRWGVTPYNMVELTLHRDQVPTSDSTETGQGDPVANNGDHPLPLFFAPVIGHYDATLNTKAVAALLPGNGFRIPSGSDSTLPYLPFALDLGTWDALIRKDTDPQWYLRDNFTQNQDTGAISKGADGILEANLYPEGGTTTGNRGTIDIGSGDNSNSHIIRQILYGLNADDLSNFPNNECIPPIWLNGDTGISAGFKEEIESIQGQMRLIPIFDEVHGNGDNAMYHIVKFVGVTVVEVKMTGNPKRILVQPMLFFDESVMPDTSGAAISDETYFTTPVLIQ
jgi:Flp pilus assembly protein TadG